MKKNKELAIFLPLRAGSERVINKNTKKISKYNYGLLELKLNQLINLDKNIEIVVSTNDKKVLDFLNSNNKFKSIIVDNRPDNLCNSQTNLEDLIRYVPQIIFKKHILWTHVTSPFVETKDYELVIQKYFDLNEHDSLISCEPINEFIWNSQTRKLINVPEFIKWPRTQDIEGLYKINNAIFINSRANYLKHQNRIGILPFFYTMDKYKSIDIDDEYDFKFAEILLNSNLL